MRGVRRKGKAHAQLLDTREIRRKTDRVKGNGQSWRKEW
jgi:hypothetical protein